MPYSSVLNQDVVNITVNSDTKYDKNQLYTNGTLPKKPKIIFFYGTYLRRKYRTMDRSPPSLSAQKPRQAPTKYRIWYHQPPQNKPKLLLLGPKLPEPSCRYLPYSFSYYSIKSYCIFYGQHDHRYQCDT